MSRIQNVLEKAVRDGSVRRMPGPEPAASPVADRDAAPPAPVTMPSAASARPVNGPLATPWSIAPPPADRMDDVPDAPIEAEEPATRLVTNARLDRRLLAAGAADSVAAEQYRALRTRILHADNGSAMNVVLVTSPGRGEGKTLTAANLALTMAQDYQRRICLVDADLRYPQLHRLFGLPDGPGLSDVLSGQVDLDDALVTIDDHQITILPAGRSHGRPAELLGTSGMRRVLDTLRSRFDRVVLDTPASVPLADVGILTPLVDSVLLVVRAGLTTKPAIHDAVAAIDSSKLLGIVLNEAA